jgi:hypothetical protein
MKKFFIKKEVLFLCFITSTILTFLLNLSNVEGLKTIADKVKKEVITQDLQDSGNLYHEVEDIIKDEALKIINLKEIYGLFHKLIGKREYDNFNYIKGKDGMMYYGSIVAGKYETMTYANRVKRAKEEAEKKGAKTLYVMLPSKILYGLSNIEGEYLINDKNGIQDDMLLSMQYCEVPTFDLRKDMLDSEYPIERLFYKTDNGWTTEAAFIATKGIVKDIKKKYKDDWDPKGFYTNIDNYESLIYKEAVTGNFGSETGVIYTGLDDYSIFYPKFDTKMEWYNMEDDEKIAGQFRETFITSDLYNNNVKYLYLSGIVDRDRIVNKSNPTGPRILCLRDRNFSAVASFLAPMCSQIDMVYVRRDQNDLDYEKLIIEEDYDYLIIVGSPYNIDDNNYDYFK